MVGYLILGLTLVVGIGWILWKERSRKHDEYHDGLTIGYLREEIAHLRKYIDAQKEIYQMDMAAQRESYLNRDVIVTDKPIVLAEEPQIEDSRYAQTQKPQVNGQWIIDKEPEGIPQWMVDTWKPKLNFAAPSKYPSWQSDGTWASAPGTTVSHVGIWTKPKGGELLGTVKLEDNRISSEEVLAKARAEAHDMIVGEHRRD
jgi:hypothetical protein